MFSNRILLIKSLEILGFAILLAFFKGDRIFRFLEVLVDRESGNLGVQNTGSFLETFFIFHSWNFLLIRSQKKPRLSQLHWLPRKDLRSR